MATREQLNSFQYTLPMLKPKQHPFNILPKGKSDHTVSGYWKACAAVFLGILVLQFTYDAVRWYQYKKVANTTAMQAIDQFKYWFGQNYPVTEQNIKSQFEAPASSKPDRRHSGLTAHQPSRAGTNAKPDCGTARQL